MRLLLTQNEADQLVVLLKVFLQKYEINLEDGSNICLDIISVQTRRRFKLYLHYERQNYHLNFMDCLTKLNLIRINLNDSFHKNANGEIIRGNRVNLFCEEEFNQRNDGQYMRAYKLPYKHVLRNPSTFLEALKEILAYVKVKETDLIVKEISGGDNNEQ